MTWYVTSEEDKLLDHCYSKTLSAVKYLTILQLNLKIYLEGKGHLLQSLEI